MWRASDWPKNRGVFVSKPPILAVEVEGEYEPEATLRSKAAWYFDHGVRIVWLVLHSSREVVGLTPTGEARHILHPDRPRRARPGIEAGSNNDSGYSDLNAFEQSALTPSAFFAHSAIALSHASSLPF